MKNSYRISNGEFIFVINQLEPAFIPGVETLNFTRSGDEWVRAFPASLPDLEYIHTNFARLGEEMIRQRAGLALVPWELALSALLERTAGQDVDWWLVGSAALAVRGLDVEPHDLDLATDAAGAWKLGELLRDCLVEPVVDCREGWISDWWGRAFLHARIEWVGDVHASVDQPEPADFGLVAASCLESVDWQGKPVRVPPLDLQLQVCKRRGLQERVEKIERYLAEQIR